ncbi:MAG: hypothetical protein ISS70_21390 [Phycisphaerae bacterium]|nr:hypothetical protein [Phycisphaerae bacterium]
MNWFAKNVYIFTFVLILLCGTVATSSPDGSADWEKKTSVTITNGDLSVHFRDNSASPKILSGIQSLFNTKGASGFDAYDPGAKGASAGMNFEHIISGHRSRSNKFTPRHRKYDLFQLADKDSVVLVRDRKDSPWDVSSTLTYRVTAPHYIDVEFRCRAHNPSLFGRRRWGIFFFANYMNDVEDVALNFLGIERAGGQEKWIAADAPKGHPDWNRGGTYRHIDAAPLECDKDVDFRLNSWSYDYPRFTRPFYYGRAAHGMVLILMFNKTFSQDDQIRFSLFKFKVPRYPRPAWDFQYVVNKVEKDREYGFKGRLVWKRFVSAQDCLREYEKWQRQATSTENSRMIS